jgi:hypothetical protein
MFIKHLLGLGPGAIILMTGIKKTDGDFAILVGAGMQT